MIAGAKFDRWEIQYDREETIRRYALLPLGTGCTCTDCAKYLALKRSPYDLEFLDIADRLGIDVEKPAELCHYGIDQTGLSLTGGWFHVVGKVISGEETWQSDDDDAAMHRSKRPSFAKLASGAEFGIARDVQLVAEVFNGLQLVQLEFFVHVALPDE